MIEYNSYKCAFSSIIVVAKVSAPFYDIVHKFCLVTGHFSSKAACQEVTIWPQMNLSTGYSAQINPRPQTVAETQTNGRPSPRIWTVLKTSAVTFLLSLSQKCDVNPNSESLYLSTGKLYDILHDNPRGVEESGRMKESPRSSPSLSDPIIQSDEPQCCSYPGTLIAGVPIILNPVFYITTSLYPTSGRKRPVLYDRLRSPRDPVYYKQCGKQTNGDIQHDNAR